MPIKPKISAWTFQNADGTNFSTVGVDNSLNIGNGSLGIYTGIGTSFEKGTTGAIIDLKGSIPYGKSVFAGNFRLRNKLTDNTKTGTLRLQPIALEVPIAKNTTYYLNPYINLKIDYTNGQFSHDSGVYTGFCRQIKKAKLFIETQLYDFKHINSKTIGFNLGVSIPLK